jgi:hypothetical protein
MAMTQQSFLSLGPDGFHGLAYTDWGDARNAHVVLCSVLGAAKRDAVRNTRALDPDPDVPGTALKLHPAAELHVDREAVDDD